MLRILMVSLPVAKKRRVMANRFSAVIGSRKCVHSLQINGSTALRRWPKTYGYMRKMARNISGSDSRHSRYTFS